MEVKAVYRRSCERSTPFVFNGAFQIQNDAGISPCSGDMRARSSRNWNAASHRGPSTRVDAPTSIRPVTNHRGTPQCNFLN